MQPKKFIYRLENITKSYDGKQVLTIPELAFAEGETCALVGPNGSGKTTLLRLLAFIERPSSGRIFFDTVPLWNGSGRHIDLARRVTMVANPPYLFNRSVAYNISYGMKIRGASREFIRQKVGETLDLVGLRGYEKRDARRLSSGEQQRVAFARALALEPQVLLLDEPTASIDKKVTREVENFITGLGAQKGITVIFSTHNQQQATSLAQRVLSLHEGRVSSFIYENYFAGSSESGGTSRIKVARNVSFEFRGDARGDVHVSIDPSDIIVSRQMLTSPGVNCFRGRLTGLTMHRTHVKLTLDAGVPLVSLLTPEKIRQLNPMLGEELYCIFDATAVRIIENGKIT